MTSDLADFPGMRDPLDIDEKFVPSRRPSLVGAAVDGSAVLVDAVTGRTHLLDPNALACWELIDGRADVGQIAAEVAANFGIEPEAVVADVTVLMRQLGQQGMLEHIVGTRDRHVHVEGEASHQHGADIAVHRPSAHDETAERIAQDVEIASGPRFLEERMSPCLEKLNRIEWTAMSTFALGGLHLGVRTTVPAVDAVLRRALAAYLVDGVDAPPNYSLLIDPKGEGYDFLYRSTAPVVRTRDPERLADGLVRHLSTHVKLPPGDLLNLKCTALVRDGVAILAPAQARGWIEAIGRRLAQAGLVFVDMPSAWVDASTAELVVPEPAIEVDWEAMKALSAAAPVGRQRPADPAVAPGRYPLAGWAFYTALEHVGPIDAPTAALFGLPQVVDNRQDPRRALQRVADVVQKVDTVGVFWDKPAEMVAPLARLAQQDREPATV